MRLKHSAVERKSESSKTNTNEDAIMPLVRIDISKTLFASIADILAAAAPANSGHDTVIKDAALDTITLKGVTVAQLQSAELVRFGAQRHSTSGNRLDAHGEG